MLLRGGRVEGIGKVHIFLRHDAQLVRDLVAWGNLSHAQTTGCKVPEFFWIHGAPLAEAKSGNWRAFHTKMLAALVCNLRGLFHLAETC